MMKQNAGKRIDNILIKLPESMRDRIEKLPAQTLQQLEEIRIRTNTDTLLISGGREYSLRDGDEITAEVLEEILNRLLDYSYYAYEEELSRGYITIEGGHRVGICGRVTLENGQVHLIKDVSSLNIRRSREITGASEKILGAVLSPAKAPAESVPNTGISAGCGDEKSPVTSDLFGVCSSAAGCGDEKSLVTSDLSGVCPSAADYGRMVVRNTLIISPPKCGKTTMLRDLARNLSNAGFRIGICDERSEIAACFGGVAQCDLGPRTDVMDGCPKSEGMLMMLRSMAPQVLAVDEAGGEGEILAMKYGMNCGCRILATVHGADVGDIMKRPAWRELAEAKVFSRYVVLSGVPGPGTIVGIYDVNFQRMDKRN